MKELALCYVFTATCHNNEDTDKNKIEVTRPAFDKCQTCHVLAWDELLSLIWLRNHAPQGIENQASFRFFDQLGKYLCNGTMSCRIDDIYLFFASIKYLSWSTYKSFYSHLSNSQGGCAKPGGGARVPDLINEEVGINVEGRIFWGTNSTYLL